MGRSRQLPGAFFYIRQRQAKVNKCLSFACKLASGVRYYTYREKWGSRYDSAGLREYGPHAAGLQGAKGFALTWKLFQSTRGD